MRSYLPANNLNAFAKNVIDLLNATRPTFKKGLMQPQATPIA
jgi:hypothetical protein